MAGKALVFDWDDTVYPTSFVGQLVAESEASSTAAGCIKRSNESKRSKCLVPISYNRPRHVIVRSDHQHHLFLRALLDSFTDLAAWSPPAALLAPRRTEAQSASFEFPELDREDFCEPH